MQKSPAKSQQPLSIGFKILIAGALVGLALFYIVGDAVLRGPTVAASTEQILSKNYGD